MSDALTRAAYAPPVAAGFGVAAFRPSYVRGRELGALARLAGPIAAVSLLNMAISLTDVAMVAWLGGDALAAAAVMSDAYSIVFYFAAGIMSALAPLIAEARGRGKASAVRHVVRHGAWAAALLAAPVAAAVWSIPALLRAAGMDPDLVATGTPYAHVMAATAVAMLPVALLRQVLSAVERPKIFMFATAAAVPLNAAGNYLLMFGPFGLPEFGLAGAAASSLAVAVALSVGLSAYAALSPSLRPYRPRRWLAPVSGALLREIFRIGAPIGISTLAETGVFLTSTLAVAFCAPEALPAHAVALRIAGVLYGPVFAVGQAATVRVALAAGARDLERMRRDAAAAIFAGMAIGGVYFAGLTLTAGALPWLFLSAADADAPAIASAAASLLLLLAVAETFQGLSSAVLGVLRGRRDTRTPTALNVASQWIAGFGVGVALAFAAGWGAEGVWAGLAVGSFCASAALCLRLLYAHG